MDDEKMSIDQPPVRSIKDDIDDVKRDITTMKFELSEIRAAFYNLANELRKMNGSLAFFKQMNAHSHC